MEKNPTTRKASVFVPLCNQYGIPSVLFTVRTKTVSSHKGHVSFPGGHMEKDETAEQAAVRELREELYGMDSVEEIVTSVIGECQTIPALTVSSAVIHSLTHSLTFEVSTSEPLRPWPYTPLTYAFTLIHHDLLRS